MYNKLEGKDVFGEIDFYPSRVLMHDFTGVPAIADLASMRESAQENSKIDASKINKELGWKPSVTFEQGLSITIDWYLNNENWLKNVTSGQYQNYYNKQYS